MSTNWLFIEPKEPLLLGNIKSNTNFLSTLDYIPGRVLRGAWAEWLIDNGMTEKIIDEVKMLQIGNFFPSPKWQKIDYVSPFLFSMLTCKQDSGFQNEPHKDNKGHGVVDSLLPQLSYVLLKKAGADLPIPFSALCQSCESRMEHEGGYFSVQRDGRTKNYLRTRLKYHSQTHAALSRYRNAAYEGMLYTATALSPKMEMPDEKHKMVALVFVGRVQGPDNKVNDLIQALNATSIGSKRTAGYGSIACQVNSANLPTLEDRLERFNEILMKCWNDLKRISNNKDGMPERLDGYYFSLDLMAPAVLRDKYGLPCLVPRLEVNSKFLEPMFWITRPDFAGGWSDTWGLPKVTALAARMGSSYVFHWDGPEDVLIDSLEKIEAKGVGERCDEGFGESWICHPFHQEVWEK